ncbi:MAG: hypothetical protein E7378_00435 [Clostridiales bacterium]|nr:hypothetical protein [Clostridiales bacterium]
MENINQTEGILSDHTSLLDGDQLNPLSDVLFIVLLYKNEEFKARAPYDIEILGKKMWEWVALAGDGAKIKTTPCTKDTDIVAMVKPFVNNEKYTVVLYSDTPLISRANVLEILDYVKARDLNVLRLKRGFVFNSKYLLNCESVLASENKLFDGQEFEMVNNFDKVQNVTKVLKNMILDFHKANGVQIADDVSTFIDADVVLEKNVTIEPNNHLKGKTYIGENTVLEPNNIIKDSIISNNVVVKASYISNSRISENTIVGPFDKIIDKNI